MAREREIKTKITIDTKGADKSVKTLKGSFEGFGKVLKSLGIISLIVGLLMTLKDMFMKNEKVVKTVETAMNFLQIVMNKVVDIVVKVVEKIKEMSKNMDGTKEVIKSWITLGLTPLKLAFNSIILAVKSLQLGWTQLFDKKNTERIAELKGDIDGLKDKLGETAEKAVEAGKNMVKNAGKMIKEVTEVGKAVVKIASDEIKSFDVKTAWSQAERAANAKKNYGLIALAAQEEIDKLEALSEKHRQDRDDTNKSFEERKKANDALIKSNKEQYEASLKLAKAHIDEAQANYNLNKNEEALLSLRTAQGEVAKAEAAYMGKVSEQKMAALGLINEEKAAVEALDNAKQQAAFEEQKAAAALIEDGEKRIAEIKKIEQAEYDANSKILENKLATLEVGSSEFMTVLQQQIDLQKQHNIDILNLDAELKKTQDAEKEKAEKERKEKEEKELKDEEDLQNKKIKQAKEAVATISQIDEQATQFRKNLLQNQLDQGLISQKEYDKQLKKIEKDAANRKKVYGVVDVVINTATSIMKFLAEGGPTMGPIMAVAAGVLGAAQVATILSTPTDGSMPSAGGASASLPSSGGGGGTAPTTSFSFSEPPKTQEQPVIKTYIVSKDVQTAQQLEKQTIANGTI